MFEKPVPETDTVSREVLTRILGTKQIDWTTPILDIAANPHLSALARPGVPPIVWETKERRSANARTVLDPIATAGQELLLHFLGNVVYTSTY
jgi:hypothetical protein